jgi:hypothetical protein
MHPGAISMSTILAVAGDAVAARERAGIAIIIGPLP